MLRHTPLVRSRFLASTLIAVTASLLGTDAVRAQESGPFDPLTAFPAESRFFLSIPEVSALRDGMAETLGGRFVRHPRVREAFAGPLALLEREWTEQTATFKALTGHDPLGLLGLFRGGITLSLRGLTPQGTPDLCIAIELGESRKAILDVMSRLQGVYEEMAELELQTTEVSGGEALLWPTPLGPILQGELGGHLVFTTSLPLYESIVALYSGDGSGKGLAAGALLRSLRSGAGSRATQVEWALDLGWALETAKAMSGGFPPDAEQVLALTGLDSVSLVGARVGVAGGVPKGAVFLGLRDGGSGLLGTLADGAKEIEDPAAALSVIPAGTTGVSVVRVHPGRLVAPIESLLEKAIPDLDLAELYEMLQAQSSLTRDDIVALGDITLHSFRIRPPAGSLFDDNIAVVRTKELAPYRQFAEKLLGMLGASFDGFRVGDLEIVTPAFGKLTPDADQVEEALSQLSIGWTPGALESGLLALAPGGSIAMCELPSGWTVLASTPQEVERYATHYSKGRMLATSDRLGSAVARGLKGAKAGTLYEADGAVLALYNTILRYASIADVLGAGIGLRPSRLPPAETFLRDDGIGYLRFDVSSKGFGVRFRAIEGDSTSLLGVVAVVGVVAGVALPSVSSGREEAYRVQCMNNLKHLHTFGMLYGDRTKTRAFPYDPSGSVASLQKLIDRYPEDFRPQMFMCPIGSETPPDTGVDGKVHLSEDTCSYEIVPWKLKTSARGALVLYDRNPHHGGGRNVVLSDGSVSFLTEAEFQARYERDRKQYGGDAGATGTRGTRTRRTRER